MILAQVSKTQNEGEFLESKRAYLKRWDDFRQRRDIFIDKFIMLRRRQESATINLKLCLCITGLKRFRAFFEQESIRIRARDRITFILTTALFRYNRKMRRFGASREDRETNSIRNVLTSHSAFF